MFCCCCFLCSIGCRGDRVGAVCSVAVVFYVLLVVGVIELGQCVLLLLFSMFYWL